MPKTKERHGALDAIIRDRGLSVYALWMKSGVHRDTITKLMSGAHHVVRGGTVRKLAAALDMDPSELVSILQGDGFTVGVPA